MLSDFVLHKMFTSSEFDGIIALELGAGTGMLTIITCMMSCLHVLQSLYCRLFMTIINLCPR